MNNSPNIDTLAAAFSGGLTLEQLRERMSWNTRTIAAPIELTPEQIEYRKAYLERVHNSRAGEITIKSRSFVQEMSYEDARSKFRLIFDERTDQIAAQKPGFQWVFTDADRLIWSNCLKYFINDPSCAWPLQKGLYLYGKPGNGKTELILMLEKFTQQNSLQKQFRYCSMSEQYTVAKAIKEYDAVTPNVQFDRCFDEMFLQHGIIKQFGNDIDLTQCIFEQRYTRFNRYGQLTHAVSNFDTKTATGLLTEMLGDRFRAMFTGVYFQGESKR